MVLTFLSAEISSSYTQLLLLDKIKGKKFNAHKKKKKKKKKKCEKKKKKSEPRFSFVYCLTSAVTRLPKHFPLNLKGTCFTFGFLTQR